MKLRAVAAIVAVGLLFSCSKGTKMKTDPGFEYILYTESKGPRIQAGDYVTIEMVYKNDKDSILFDSRQNGKPMRFKLETIPFHGSYEEGLTYLAANDSARFFVPADSLYRYLFRSRTGEAISQEKTGLTPGKFLTFDIKVIKVQTEVEAEEEMQLMISQKLKQEKIDMAGYIQRKNIQAEPDSSGYYLFIRSKGKGPAIDSGKVVIVEYEGRFLNDSVFDGTQKAGKQYRFISGAKQVIPGWERVMKFLHGGDKITLLLPSTLAYGEAGIKNGQTGDYIVPPVTPLVFDIDIISVEEVPAVSRK
jgi:FKBP-type peptidyl-prolyl cis-trans isomerase